MSDRYRVGRHWPGNIYRDEQRFAFCLRDEDGPLVVEAMNGAGAELARLRQVISDQSFGMERLQDVNKELRKHVESLAPLVEKSEVVRLRFFLAGVLSLSANQALSMSTMDMVTMLAHQRDELRGLTESEPRKESERCMATDGVTGIDCSLIRYHSLSVDHEGTTTDEQTNYAGHPIFVRWPWQEHDRDYGTVVLSSAGSDAGGRQ